MPGRGRGRRGSTGVRGLCLLACAAVAAILVPAAAPAGGVGLASTPTVPAASAPLPDAAAPARDAEGAVEDIPASVLAGSARRPPAPLPPWVPEAPIYSVITQVNVPVRMADGTVLRANILSPASAGQQAPGPFPVLLTQTPYGKGAFGADLYLVQRGFIEAVVDVRGTGASHGSWGLLDPVQIADGVTLVHWAAGLPHCNGRVGLFGASYLGINQMLTAAAVGPSSPLKAIFPILAASDIYRDLAVMGGLLDREFDTVFLGITGSDNLAGPAREAAVEGVQTTSPQDLAGAELEHLDGLRASHAGYLAELETGGERAFDGPYWAARRPRNALAGIVANGIPAYLIGGWHDLFQRGEPLNYAGLQNAWAHRPVTAPMAPNQRVTGRYQLLMGPWYHYVPTGEQLELLQLEWFDTWLRGEPTGMGDTPTPLHAYELGTHNVLHGTAWPPAHATGERWFLGPGRTETASSVNDGSLTPAPPTEDGEDAIAFSAASEPCAAPIEQWSGGALSGALGSAGGPENPCVHDDRAAETGPTALTYTSAPLPRPVMLAGPIGVTLFASSTTKDCEWVVTVDDVAPDGSSTALTEGALLGSMRALDAGQTWWGADGAAILPVHLLTAASVQPVTPGAMTRYDVEVLPTVAAIGAGHRLRLTISTSDTPHLVPTAGELAGLLGGVYHLEHARALASYVELPLGPEGRL